MANRIAAIAKVPELGLLGGMLPVAYNRLAMLTGYIATNERFVTCPNLTLRDKFGRLGVHDATDFCF